MVVDWGYGGGGDSTIKAYICFNEIYLDDATGGAIFTSWLYDSWIVSNTISGHGFMGIYIGFWAHHWSPYWGTVDNTSSGNKILFNDVSDLTLEPLEYYYSWPFFYDPITQPVAGIWLGPLTNNNLVIHHGDTDDVTDLGTNTIIIF